MPRRCTDVRRGTGRNDAGAYTSTVRVVKRSTRPGSWLMNNSVVLESSTSRRNKSKIPACVIGSKELVGSSAISLTEEHTGACAIATRLLLASAELMRICAVMSCLIQADPQEHLARSSPGSSSLIRQSVP